MRLSNDSWRRNKSRSEPSRLRESTQSKPSSLPVDNIALYKNSEETEYTLFNLAEYDHIYCGGCTFEDMMLKAFKKDKNFILAVVPIRAINTQEEIKSEVASSQQTFSKVFRFASVRESGKSSIVAQSNYDQTQSLKNEVLSYVSSIEETEIYFNVFSILTQLFRKRPDGYIGRFHQDC